MPSAKKNGLIKSMLIAGSMSVLSGCFHDGEDNSVTSLTYYAVISTQSSDYSSGDISIISLDDYSADNTNYGGPSDTSISTDGEYVYRIGRLPQDNITKVNMDPVDFENVLWQFSTNGSNESGSSNPYKLVVKNENTAYLIRYGQSTIWIVDPSVEKNATIAEFKTGEIDLSQYTSGDSDTTPEAADALLIDNKLYVMIQNLDANYAPGVAYVALFDTENSNLEIETNSNSDTPKGIELKTTNPKKMEYLATNNTIYLSGVGSYAPDYAGGIEKINLADYSTEIIVDDGDVNEHPYGQTVDIAILNSTRGYFVGYTAWKDTAVYSFNPSTGKVDATPLLENADISDIEIGPLGNLWVTNRNQSGVTIFDTVDNSVFKALIDTGLAPNDIEFVSVNGK